MKYALLQKSIFSLPRVILDSFVDAFSGLWAPQILLNRFWEALLILKRKRMPADLDVSFNVHCVA